MYAALLALPLALCAAAPRTPVLVELFTSEGCSSCPPADEALARLVRTQPVEGVEVLALGFHVDYWDSLGWRDAYGLPSALERQRRYARGGDDNTLYTPQLVVDGVRSHLANQSQVRQALAEAGRRPKPPLQLTARVQGDTVVLRVRLQSPPPPGTRLWAALTEDGLSSRVTRGENAGRTLVHAAVVRAWVALPSPQAGEGGLTSEARLKLQPSWRRQALRAVAVLEDAQGPVRGLASALPGVDG